MVSSSETYRSIRARRHNRDRSMLETLYFDFLRDSRGAPISLQIDRDGLAFSFFNIVNFYGVATDLPILTKQRCQTIVYKKKNRC